MHPNLNKFLSLNKNSLAFLFILIITIIYLHPVFLGKVDIPIDIRNIQMYPWRYYSVDKQIKKHVLWERIFSQNETVLDAEIGEKVFDFKIPPNQIHTLKFYPNYDKALLDKLDELRDKHYYLIFDFKSKYSNLGKLSFGTQFVLKNTTKYLRPKAEAYPSEFNKDYKNPSWYTIYIPLQNDIPLNSLSNYEIHIVSKNPSKAINASLYIKDLKIVCEDFSKINNIKNPYTNDLIQWFTPAREYFSESLKKGKLPFWSNCTLTGSEFIAEPQVGFFHPFYIFCYLLFDHFTAHSILIFVCLLLSGIGAFFLSRYWNLSFGASLLTSIVYMFHPFNVTWFSFEHMLMNSATLPFLLLAYDKNIYTPTLLNKYLLISSLLLGLIFISGHLQIVYYTVIFFFMFCIYKLLLGAFLKKGDFVKNLSSILFIFSLASMIGAVVLVPFFPLFNASHRVANSIEFIKNTSVSLKSFLELLYPFYKGIPTETYTGVSILDPDYKMGFFRNYAYFGFLPFLISIFSLRLSFQKNLSIFFLLCLSFSLLICTGSPIFFLIKDYVPGFKQLQHYRFLEVYSFCVPFLTGIGFQVLLNHLSFLKQRTVKFIITMVILVASIDLMYCSSYFVTWSDRKDYKPLPSDGALEFLVNKQKKSQEPFRVLPFSVQKIRETKLKVNVAQPNTLQPYKLEDVSGYSSLISKDIYSLFVYIQTKDPSKLYSKEIIQLFPNTNIPYPIYNFRSKILDLLNVRYFLVPNVLTLDAEDTKRVFVGDCAIYENKNCLPRAFVVPKYSLIKSQKETIVKLESEDFNPREEVLLMSFPYKSDLEEANNKKTALNYSVNFEEYNNEKTTLNVIVSRPSILVLGSNLNQNWRVKVNGKKADHYQANLVQRAIYLPDAGSYVIEFYYFPKLFLIGLGIATFAMLILIILTLILKYKNKTSKKYQIEEQFSEPSKIGIGV